MNSECLKYIKTKKAWVLKKAVVANAKHKRIAWLLSNYNRGIPCKIIDIDEGKVKIVVNNKEWKQKITVWVPFIAVSIHHKLFKHSIPLLVFVAKDLVTLEDFLKTIKKQEDEYLKGGIK